MAKFKFKKDASAEHFELSAVQDVKVNNVSVFDGENADIKLKTINNQNIVGTGNINISAEGEYVKYTPNQNLTTQQKLNARSNIDALGNAQVKQQTGDSTTDVISQKGITDELANKQNNKPNGTNSLISTDTGKIDLIYIPSTVLGGITNGGTFNGSGIITASSYAPELQGEKIDEVQFASYPSYYFICSAPYSFAGYEFAVGDWAISLGNGWAKLNATDAVTSVNNKMGQVVLDYTDVGAVKSAWGIDNINKNLVTDSNGNVITSDYALGQIIVDNYLELPNNVPETAKATVRHSIELPVVYTTEEPFTISYEQSTPIPEVCINPTGLTQTVNAESYLSLYNDEKSYYIAYNYDMGNDPCFYLQESDTETGDYVYYIFSWTEQLWLGDEETMLQIGWNKLYYDSVSGDLVVETSDVSEVPRMYEVVCVEKHFETSFIYNFVTYDTKLAGDYIYTEVTPSTEPKTYYWQYTPTNVQSDNDENNPLSLSYIKNKPFLDTTITSNLPTNANELIQGTIKLHKISKSGNYSDLRNQVGKRDETTTTGEVFNIYSGSYKNIASGNFSHSEGYNNSVLGNYGHAEGENNSVTASATHGHAEGKQNTVSNIYAHGEGYQNTASGIASHAEGNSTTSSGNYTHAEGQSTTANANYSHAEGLSTTAGGVCSHTEGYLTKTTADYTHAEGYDTAAQGIYAHAEGLSTVASGAYTHAEGNLTMAASYGAHAEGNGSKAMGNYSHAEGNQTVASYESSHAEGSACSASNVYAHAEGSGTDAIGIASHTEGNNTRATGNYSHSQGNGCQSGGVSSHAEGTYTLASSENQHVQGKYNVEDANNVYADIIGNGTNSNQRANIQTTDWNGNLWVKGGIRTGGTDWSTGTPIGGGGGSTSLKKTLTNSSQNYSVLNNVVTVTDADVTTSTHVMLYPSDATTETWLESNLSSCIITEASGSFSFSISANLPATFSMYYIIMEVQ